MAEESGMRNRRRGAAAAAASVRHRHKRGAAAMAAASVRHRHRRGAAAMAKASGMRNRRRGAAAAAAGEAVASGVQNRLKYAYLHGSMKRVSFLYIIILEADFYRASLHRRIRDPHPLGNGSIHELSFYRLIPGRKKRVENDTKYVAVYDLFHIRCIKFIDVFTEKSTNGMP
eukprot:744568-Pleurochrysis_carterae.AAC.2